MATTATRIRNDLRRHDTIGELVGPTREYEPSELPVNNRHQQFKHASQNKLRKDAGLG